MLVRVAVAFRRMLPIVGASVVLAVAGLWIVRRLPLGDLLAHVNEVAGNYLQTVGTIYAVLLAFVVFVVWSQYNDARLQVEREANELVDLVRTARSLAGAVRGPVHALALAYVDGVLRHEWPAMRDRDEKVLAEGGKVLERLWDALVRAAPASDVERSLFDEALARFNDLSDARANRLSSSRLRLPLALRVLIHSGAVITIGSMYLFAVDRFAAHALMTGAMAGAVAHVLYVIEDLDNCFAGDWQVPREPFERVRRYLLEHCEVAPAAVAAA